MLRVRKLRACVNDHAFTARFYTQLYLMHGKPLLGDAVHVMFRKSRKLYLNIGSDPYHAPAS